MTTIVLVIASVWAIGALSFFAALCLAARRPMPKMESFDDASQFYSGTVANLAAESLSREARPVLGAATSLLTAKGNRA